ncbi:STAS domain-containing protein [Guptibacillus hwajinpoensis]|uniref:STAS domain-containing protein n=1 Tax=Guptibacillus hwajinpoensis TaxID=208199 RepID=UPI001CFC6E7F|nr:STAS domain-containing protein [Pseudalkalibacillus hwajinpoensis]WLR58355.1 PAS domain-containing protein [Pseudalkalibacillus hwajinpoensis]
MKVNKEQLKRMKRNEFVRTAIEYVDTGVVITDPELPDNPIVYTNEGFEKLSGYSTDEIIGNNCRFLQGADSDKETVAQLRTAIQNEEKIKVEIKNYKKNGEFFWNELQIYPVYFESEHQTFFVGVQQDVTKRKMAEERSEHYFEQVKRLSTPIVPIDRKVSIVPIVGHIDDERIDLILKNVSAHIQKSGDEYLIIDLSGVSHFTSELHKGVYQLHQLIKLMGAELMLTGARPDFVLEGVQADFSLSSVKSFPSVQHALITIN